MTAHRIVFAGIDPGTQGAIGLVDQDGRFVTVEDMPVLPTSTGRRQVDASGLASILRLHAPAFVLVERVGPRPGEGAVGGFGFGHSFGCILGVLGALELPHGLIQPAVWKRRAGIPPRSDKAMPAAGPHLSRAKDDGRAESLLLAVQAWQARGRQ